MTFRTPFGRPAAVRIEPIHQKQRGDISDPLRMQVLPAARAYNTARKPRTKGAFLDILSALSWLVKLGDLLRSPDVSDVDVLILHLRCRRWMQGREEGPIRNLAKRGDYHGDIPRTTP